MYAPTSSNTDLVRFYASRDDSTAFYSAVRTALFKGHPMAEVISVLIPHPDANEPENHLQFMEMVGDSLTVRTATETATISPRTNFEASLYFSVSQQGARHPMFEINPVSLQLSTELTITVCPNLLQPLSIPLTASHLQLLTDPYGLPVQEPHPNESLLSLHVEAYVPYVAPRNPRIFENPFTWVNTGNTTVVPSLLVELQVSNSSKPNQGPQTVQKLFEAVGQGASVYDLKDYTRDYLVHPFLELQALTVLYAGHPQWTVGHSLSVRPQRTKPAPKFDIYDAWVFRRNMRFVNTMLVATLLPNVDLHTAAFTLPPMCADAFPFFREITADLPPDATYTQRFYCLQNALQAADAIQQQVAVDLQTLC